MQPTSTNSLTSLSSLICWVLVLFEGYFPILASWLCLSVLWDTIRALTNTSMIIAIIDIDKSIYASVALSICAWLTILKVLWNFILRFFSIFVTCFKNLMQKPYLDKRRLPLDLELAQIFLSIDCKPFYQSIINIDQLSIKSKNSCDLINSHHCKTCNHRYFINFPPSSYLWNHWKGVPHIMALKALN